MNKKCERYKRTGLANYSVRNKIKYRSKAKLDGRKKWRTRDGDKNLAREFGIRRRAWGDECAWWIVNHLEDRRHQFVKTIIRRRSRESAQQRDVVPSRPQTRTKGDEGHRVGLGTTHSGHQNVVTQQGLDQ